MTMWSEFMFWSRFHGKYRLAAPLVPLLRWRARQYERRLARPAALLEPSSNADWRGSWLGAVRISERGESWPRNPGGVPLSPVFQLNLTDCPVVPDTLRQYSHLTLHVAAMEGMGPGDVWLPDWDEDAPHGAYWRIRMYRPSDDLVQTAPPPNTLIPRGRAAKWSLVEKDSPNIITDITPATYPVRAGYSDKNHHETSKLGGWPTFIQGAWAWRPWSLDEALPIYVFQIASDTKAGLSWGDGGAASFGLDEAGDWHVAWACY